MAITGGSVALKAGVNATFSKTTDGVETLAANSSTADKTYSVGTNADSKFDAIIIGIGKVISAGATLSFDLAGGAGENQIGESISMAKVKSVYVYNKSTNPGTNLKIGGNANAVPLFSTAASYLTLTQSGVFVVTGPLAAGHCAVTAGTGDILDLVNLDGANAATIDYVISGTTS